MSLAFDAVDAEEEERRFAGECVSILRDLTRNAAEQRRVWDELGELTSDVDSVALQVELVSDCRHHQLMVSRERAAALARSVAAAAKEAESSSAKVKKLDQLKGRVDETLELVLGVTKQQDSLESIQTALQTSDLEAAAEGVAAYFDTEALLSKMAALEGGDSSLPLTEEDADDSGLVHVRSVGVSDTTEELRQKRKYVREEVRKEFAAAAQRRDRDSVLRFSRLFPRLGIAQEGSELYAQWLRQGLGAQLAEYVESALEKIQSQPDGQQSHLTLVNQVLDHVASCIETEEPHVRGCFGTEGLKTCIMAIHQEGTTHSVNVLNAFSSHRLAGGGADGREFASLGAQQMDQTLEEVSQLSHNCNLYFNFLQSRVSAPSDQQKHLEVAQLSASSAFGSSKLFDKLQELLGIYVPLQREYFQAAFAHASALADAEAKRVADEHRADSSRSPTTRQKPKWLGGAAEAMEKGLGDAQKVMAAGLGTFGISQEEDWEGGIGSAGRQVVDDVFYVLRVSVGRAAHTKNGGIICTVVNLINDVIRDRLLPWIRDRVGMKRDAAVMHSRALEWMNAAERAKSYSTKLADEFEALCKRHFADSPKDMAKFLELAHDIRISAQAVGEVLDGWTHSVAKAVAKQMTASGLAVFDELSYELTQEIFLHNEINDPWVREAIARWDSTLQHFQKWLNRGNLDDLVAEIVGIVAKQMEASIRRKQYNLCGGLQADKDVRAVKQFFSDKTERPVRDRFTRLSHITSLLILDRAQDADELCSSSLLWRLTPQEAMEVLSLRKDFTREELRRLRIGKQ
eukprot:TRINITY_DN3080_c0_g1_i1.p1 TRINITY_DN3080_c0_g1~~TRINITY_DN3080_c0_g1_i1.p1  ORF type:complete len:821 (+),score=322.99 TRINITY_DN3080_c0_g1_i1:67-2463(+)